jgi:hypothetical protein
MQLLAPEHLDECSNDSDIPLNVSTAPGREFNSWDQAVVFATANATTRTEGTVCEGVRVIDGQKLSVSCHITDDLIDLRAVLPDDMNSTAGNTVTTASIQDTRHIPERERVSVRVGEMDLAALNDFHVTEVFMSALHRCDVAWSTHGRGEHLAILEITDIWRSYALIFKSYLKQLYPNTADSDNFAALVMCTSQQQEEYLSQVARSLKRSTANTSAISGVRLQTGALVDAYGSERTSNEKDEAKDARLPTPMDTKAGGVTDNNGERSGEQFDVIVCNLIEGSGMMKQGILADISFALQFMMRQRKASCSQNLMQQIVPYSLGVVLSLVEIPKLYSQFRIDPSRTVEVN